MPRLQTYVEQYKTILLLDYNKTEFTACQVYDKENENILTFPQLANLQDFYPIFDSILEEFV